MAWTGFTDDQLNALKRQGSDEEEKPVRGGRGQHHQRGRGRPGGSRGRGRAGPPQSVSQEPVRQDQMLSRPKPQGPRGKPVSSAEHNVWSKLNEPTERRPPPARRKAPPPSQGKAEDRQKDGPKDVRMDPKQVVKDIEKESQEAVKEEEVEKFKILDEEEGHERETFKLGEFQKKQKQMEEDNVRKKKLLFRAIADRKKKTQAEAKRLLYIQKELAKIETLLTNDVSILRDKIEDVSRDFNDAQQRYQKAETEFVAAKIHLHKSSEKKELLTEHLCTIIHENELRKAKKLEELVSKLDVESLEEFDIPEETPPTSPVPITVPHQAEVTKNPSENHGMVQVSSNNPGNLPKEQENSIVPPGISSIKLNSTAESEVTSPSNNDKQTEKLPNDKADKSDGKTEGKTTDLTVSCDQGGKKDEKPMTKNEGDLSSEKPESSESPSSSDQPEAEQHVELNANQT